MGKGRVPWSLAGPDSKGTRGVPVGKSRVPWSLAGPNSQGTPKAFPNAEGVPVGPEGLEPSTNGLKARCSAS